MYRVLITVSLLACAVPAEEGKTLLKPMRANGAPEAIDGLLGNLKPAKNEFGPGESIMLNWKINNQGDRAVSLGYAKDRQFLTRLEMEIVRDGKQSAHMPLTGSELKKNDEAVALEEGKSVGGMLDLRAVNWTDKKLLEPLGAYRIRLGMFVTINGAGRKLFTNWVDFKITEPGEARPELTAQQAEEIATLIGKLNDADEEARWESNRKLVQLGKLALGPLEDAAHTAHGDAKSRIESAIRGIHKAINPPPPPIIEPPRPQPRPRPLPPPPPPVPAPQPQPGPIERPPGEF